MQYKKSAPKKKRVILRNIKFKFNYINSIAPDVVVQISSVRIGQTLHVLPQRDRVAEVVVHAAAEERRKRPEHRVVDHHPWKKKREAPKRSDYKKTRRACLSIAHRLPNIGVRFTHELLLYIASLPFFNTIFPSRQATLFISRQATMFPSS